MFLQFELWKNCSFGCAFCFNRDIVKKQDKLKRIAEIINHLNSEEADNYDEFGIMGGEIFNNELDTLELKQDFYKLIDVLIDKLKTGKAKRCLICTSMMYSNNSHFLEFCAYINKNCVDDKFLICTSFDLIGRFNLQKLYYWKHNVKALHDLYPRIPLHVEMIMTEVLLKSVIDNKFNPKKFEEKYKCRIDYMVPVTGYSNKQITKQEFDKEVLSGFFPKRETLLQFLSYVYTNGIFSKADLENFINIKNHSDRFYFGNGDDEWELMDNRHDTEDKVHHYMCKPNTSGYIDSEVHPREDVEDFLKMIGD